MIYTLYSERSHAGHELMTICIYSIWEQNPTSLPWTRPAASRGTSIHEQNPEDLPVKGTSDLGAGVLPLSQRHRTWRSWLP